MASACGPWPQGVPEVPTGEADAAWCLGVLGLPPGVSGGLRVRPEARVALRKVANGKEVREEEYSQPEVSQVQLREKG